MIEKFFPDPCSQQRLFSRPLASYLDGFAALLAAEGYAKTILKDKLRLVAHLLRHSLATRLLGSGASLEEIGQLLRHTHPQTTEIYTKVDLCALRALAQPLPGGGV
jgi:site-specific recombinase XerD